MTTTYKFRHFYLNKYLIKPFSKNRYFLSYDYAHKALWFRVYKAATRSIDHHLKSESAEGQYIYSSEVGYCPSMFKNYFKFAFVRNPETRFISGWKDKVLNQNYFHFGPEEHEEMKHLDAFIQWVKTLDVRTCDEHLRAQYALIDLNHIDFLGRFESFNRDFEYVAGKIGLKTYKPVHLNQTQKDSGIEISEAQKRALFEIYRKDFEFFYPCYAENLTRE